MENIKSANYAENLPLHTLIYLNIPILENILKRMRSQNLWAKRMRNQRFRIYIQMTIVIHKFLLLIFSNHGAWIYRGTMKPYSGHPL